jgi:hypothetical protein
VNIENEEFKKLIDKVILEGKHSDRTLFDSLPAQTKNTLSKVLNELIQKGNSPTLDSLWEIDYEEKPIGIIEFLQDDYYLGESFGPRLYKGWIPHLEEMYSKKNNFLEFCITGSIGIGKSEISSACMLYDLYNLLCLRNPQSYYGLTPNTKIIFAIFNITLALAGGVGGQKWSGMIEKSPYFQNVIEFNPRSPNSVNFPKNIGIVVGSNFKHSLGLAVFSAFLDEANFGHDSDSDTSQIMQTYNSVLRRMESRFMEAGGKIPGHTFLVSSKKSKNDFLETHIQENKHKDNTYVVD